jgi:hypothetical protein
MTTTAIVIQFTGPIRAAIFPAINVSDAGVNGVPL